MFFALFLVKQPWVSRQETQDMQETNEVERFRTRVDAAREAVARPKTIIYFEWIMFGVLLLAAIQEGLFIAIKVHLTINEPEIFDGYSAIIVVSLVMFLVLTLLVSRRRSRVAMWILIVAAAVNSVAAIQEINSAFSDGFDFDDIYIQIMVVVGILHRIVGVLVCGLFLTPSVRYWMAHDNKLSAEEVVKIFE